MKAAIITAMPEEARAVLAGCGSHRKSVLDGLALTWCSSGSIDLLVVESGMGSANASRTAETIVRCVRPDLLISAGFGGGVTPGLATGAVVVAERVLRLQGEQMVDIKVTAPDLPPMAGAVHGTVITANGILRKSDLAAWLGDGAANPVVDMESAAVATVAATHGVLFLGIRAISDPWDEELGFSIEEFCDREMRISFAKVAGTVLRRPWLVPQLIRLAGNSRIAARSLTAFFSALLQNQESYFRPEK